MEKRPQQADREVMTVDPAVCETHKFSGYGNGTEARERELLRVNRALSTLTRATEALIHASDEQQLLNDICRIVVEVGGYRFAWVGYVQHDDEKSVWPVARSGADNGYLAQARLTWADDERGNGPTGRAIRLGTPQNANTADADSGFSPWRDAAIRRGFRATLSLPLHVENRVIGVLNLYSSEHDAFDDDEISLMENLARNVAYGIDMQRIQFERRRAERELKESEGRYRSLVELSPDAILVHTQGVIIFSNSAADRLFHADDEHPLVGKRILDLMDNRDADCPHHLEALEGDEVPHGALEEQLMRLDGGPFMAEVTTAPIVFHGVHARQVVIRDITERKQVHDQLVQTAKLATLGEMAAGMAHELSQPINIMRMAAEGALLMIARQKATQDYQVKQFALISAQAGRMAEIIDHIRIFSRKESGEVVVFDARNSLRLAIELVEPQMQGKEIDIAIDLPDIPCPVRGRPVQLEQVVLNLLTNAADAVQAARAKDAKPQPGRISLLARVIDGRLRVALTDNGTGIPPSDMDRIFEPFFTTKQVGSGTGLGLSVSFGIISSMGGRLEARNAAIEEGGGAQFVIKLPLIAEAEVNAELPAKTSAEDHDPAPAATGRHILLVDDEPFAIENMSTYLHELGYRVSRAHSGNSALLLYRKDPADLVVTDVRMPDGDGETLVHNLRQLTPHLPIIVVTGHIGATEKLDREADLKNLVIMKKPISLAAMAETLEKLLQNH